MSADIESSDAAPVSIFINYRRGEAAGWARALYERLAAKFGRANVFFDQASLEPGERWAEKIHSESFSCTALIALIGPEWAKVMKERSEEKGQDDYVRKEIEPALERDTRVRAVIPTLVGGAKLPEPEDLLYTGSLERLLEGQEIELRPSSWDADVERLVEKLKQLGVEEAAPAPPEASAPPEPSPQPQASAPEPPPQRDPAAAAEQPAGPPVVPPPEDPGHYEEIVEKMREEDVGVVPFLGPGVNSCGRTERWENPNSTSLPDTEELAAYLIEKFEIKGTPASLPLVSQGLSVDSPSPLFNILEKVLPTPRSPGPVHRFLANLPEQLRRCGAPNPYQVIVTANYDNALERAFKEVRENYDVAVYVKDDGRFIHFPHEGKPRPADPPNEYDGFPIDGFGRVERTVIMKIHGAVDRLEGPYPWEDNYVITEDDYISYMSEGSITSIVPLQLYRQLIKYSHFLFLGHEMHDWSLRVFLLRLFSESKKTSTSWAIQREPDELDKRFWRKMDAELFGIPLDAYVKRLEEQLTQAASAHQPQA